MLRTLCRIGKSLRQHRTLNTFAVCSRRDLSRFAASSSPLSSRHVPCHVFSCGVVTQRCCSTYIEATDGHTDGLMKNDIRVVENFVSEEEEQLLIEEVEPYLKRLRYEKDHWDDVRTFMHIYNLLIWNLLLLSIYFHKLINICITDSHFGTGH